MAPRLFDNDKFGTDNNSLPVRTRKSMNRGKSMKSLKKAQGITLIGFVFVLAILGVFLFAGMQIGPVYMDHMSVVKAMKTVANEGGASMQPSEIKSRISKLLYVSYVDQVKPTDFKVIRGNGRELQVKYTVEKPFLFNLSFLMKFEERVPLN